MAKARERSLVRLLGVTGLRRSELLIGTALRARPGLRPSLRRSGNRLSLDVIDTTVSWPLDAERALRRALSGDTFRPSDLEDLDPDEQLVVARRLLREGIVVPADPGPARE